MMIKIELAGAFLLSAVALGVFGGQNSAVETRTFKTFANPKVIDANGPRGVVVAPAGAMTVVNSFPKGVNEK